MITTFRRQKIEILVDAPLVRRVAAAAAAVGIVHYTLLPTLGGVGARGAWSDDQVTGAEAKVLFVAVTGEDRAEALAEALAPLLDSHGLMLTIGPVEVVRGGKF